MIRLTLLLTAGLVGAMLVFGTEEPGLARAEIAQTVLEGDGVAVVVSEPVVETVIEPAVEPVARARAETVDMTQPKLISFLSAADAPADAVLETSAKVEAAPETAAPQELLYVTGSRVNLRAGPSTGHAVLGKLGRGDVAVLLGPGPEGWTRIRDIETGSVGFMSSDFLSPRDPAG